MHPIIISTISTTTKLILGLSCLLIVVSCKTPNAQADKPASEEVNEMMLNTELQNAKQRPMKIIYVGDPMCSWCYGFSDELSAIVDHYADDAELEIVMGGLRPYFEKPIAEMKDFLSHHWEDVHAASGMPFEYGILDRADLKYDTEPPCRAVVVARELSPSSELAFFKASQAAFYFENKDMSQAESYHPILAKRGLSTTDFDKLFHSEEMKMRVKQDFNRAKTLGVRSFPTMLIEYQGKREVIAQGYAKSTTIMQKIDSITKSK